MMKSALTFTHNRWVYDTVSGQQWPTACVLPNGRRPLWWQKHVPLTLVMWLLHFATRHMSRIFRVLGSFFLYDIFNVMVKLSDRCLFVLRLWLNVSHCDRRSSRGSHICEPSTVSLSYPALPKHLMGTGNSVRSLPSQQITHGLNWQYPSGKLISLARISIGHSLVLQATHLRRGEGTAGRQ